MRRQYILSEKIHRLREEIFKAPCPLSSMGLTSGKPNREETGKCSEVEQGICSPIPLCIHGCPCDWLWLSTKDLGSWKSPLRKPHLSCFLLCPAGPQVQQPRLSGALTASLNPAHTFMTLTSNCPASGCHLFSSGTLMGTPGTNFATWYYPIRQVA